MEGYLRYMCRDKPKTLDYNTKFHSSTRTTPCEILYGQSPPLHIPYLLQGSMVEAVNRSLEARESTIRMLKHHLLLAQ